MRDFIFRLFWRSKVEIFLNSRVKSVCHPSSKSFVDNNPIALDLTYNNNNLKVRCSKSFQRKQKKSFRQLLRMPPHEVKMRWCLNMDILSDSAWNLSFPSKVSFVPGFSVQVVEVNLYVTKLQVALSISPVSRQCVLTTEGKVLLMCWQVSDHAIGYVGKHATGR